ncbi:MULTISPECIES: hypothetical protein [Streptomyces rochei group]|uniref:hypothetical protein n=1 Tax=Streptomyces rochei group TaxID=2867164 RepID=UPI00187382EB|nr:hypothetical protein [Streptomyces vinaceusdrappus]GHC28822.1 hypothetical protein GCM10010308_52600 [Streptomyces vinaceusdrappus]
MENHRETAEQLGHASVEETSTTYGIGAPPAGQTAPLRDRIAEALVSWTYRGKDPEHGGILETVRANAYSRADAVLAVLPAAAGHDTDDVAARTLASLERVTERARRAEARVRELEQQAATGTRRMADETATTETQAGAPGRRQTVEYFVQSQQPDGTWESASSFSTDLDFAAARLAARREKMPDLTLRLAERTTTVAVRALPDCLSCRHWSCDGTGECGALLDAWQRCDCTGPAAGARQDGAQP